MVAAGTWADPALLEGWWADHSSQVGIGAHARHRGTHTGKGFVGPIKLCQRRSLCTPCRLQVAVAARYGSLHLEQDVWVATKPWRAVINATASLLDPPQAPRPHGAVPAPVAACGPGGGRRGGELAGVRGTGGRRGSGGARSDGLVEGEVHVMPVPWHDRGAEDRTKFKVTGLRTC